MRILGFSAAITITLLLCACSGGQTPLIGTSDEPVATNIGSLDEMPDLISLERHTSASGISLALSSPVETGGHYEHTSYTDEYSNSQSYARMSVSNSIYAPEFSYAIYQLGPFPEGELPRTVAIDFTGSEEDYHKKELCWIGISNYTTGVWDWEPMHKYRSRIDEYWENGLDLRDPFFALDRESRYTRDSDGTMFVCLVVARTGEMRINSGHVFTSTDGLVYPGDFVVDDEHPSLPLNKIENLTGSLYITGENPNCSALESLKFIGGNLVIDEAESLFSFNPAVLKRLEAVGGNVLITDSNIDKTLFSSLTTIGGGVSVKVSIAQGVSFPKLQSVGTHPVELFNGNLIYSNPIVLSSRNTIPPSLEFPELLNVQTGDFELSGIQEQTDSVVELVLPKLVSFEGSFTISGFASASIDAPLLTSAKNVNLGGVKDIPLINLPLATKITYLYLAGSNIGELNFDSLEHLGGFTIQECPNLTDLDAFSSVRKIGDNFLGSLEIRDNENLRDISALQELRLTCNDPGLTFFFYIGSNPQLIGGDQTAWDLYYQIFGQIQAFGVTVEDNGTELSPE